MIRTSFGNSLSSVFLTKVESGFSKEGKTSEHLHIQLSQQRPLLVACHTFGRELEFLHEQLSRVAPECSQQVGSRPGLETQHNQTKTSESKRSLSRVGISQDLLASPYQNNINKKSMGNGVASLSQNLLQQSNLSRSADNRATQFVETRP